MFRKAPRHAGSKARRAGVSRLASCFRALAPSCLCIFSLACADQYPDAQSRQEALLADPFSYKTDDERNISGGKINELDREGLKKDLNNVLNP